MISNIKLISDYTDGYMSEKKISEFMMRIRKDKSLRDDFELMQNINAYMKGKLLSDEIETETNFSFVEKEAKDDIFNFLQTGKNESSILNYLSIAFPDRSEIVQSTIKKSEKEARKNNIDDITKEWVNEFSDQQTKHLKEYSEFVLKPKIEKYKLTDLFSSKNIKYTIIAASIALFLIINNFFTGKSKNETIFAEYHKIEKISGIQIRNPEFTSRISFEKAVELYNTGKYDEASVKFNQITIENKNFVQAKYYFGLALFEAKEYNESAEIFKQVLNEFDVFQLEADWHLALIYIKLNQLNKAVPYLKILASQKNLHQNDAKNILELID